MNKIEKYDIAYREDFPAMCFCDVEYVSRGIQAIHDNVLDVFTQRMSTVIPFKNGPKERYPKDARRFVVALNSDRRSFGINPCLNINVNIYFWFVGCVAYIGLDVLGDSSFINDVVLDEYYLKPIIISKDNGEEKLCPVDEIMMFGSIINAYSVGKFGIEKLARLY